MPQDTPPRDNIVRSVFPGPEFRAAASPDDGIGLMTGHFAVFDQWTEINSVHEGHFLERIAPGAFKRTLIENRDSIRVLYDHGQDPSIGNKVLGQSRYVEEDGAGAAYAVPLDDTSYNRDLLPGLKHVPPSYGASFRFSVAADTFDREAKRSAYNPKGLPERTITDINLFEFGPVTFPAYAGASAGVRSGTDEYLRSLSPVTPPRASAPKENPLPATDYVTRDEKAARVVELRSAISARAVEYPGVFPADIQAADDAENAEHDTHVRDIAAWDGRQARLRAFADAMTVNSDRNTLTVGQPFTPPTVIRTQSIEDIHDLGKIYATSRTNEEYRTNVRSAALRSVDAQRSAKDLNYLVDIIENHDEGRDTKGEIAERVLITGSPVYRRAFAKYLKRGNTDTLTVEERAAIAVVGTTTTGGYAVPYIFDPTMYHTGVWTAENPYRKACRTVAITNGNNWLTVTVGAITSAYATEALAAGENAPAFGQPSYTVQRAQAFATLSIETLEDRSDITQELTSVFAESKDTLEENEFTLGTGATVHPFGMFRTLAYTAQTTATNDVTALLDLQVVEGALPLRYRANAAWFMNRSTLRQFLALDTTYRYFTGAGIQYPGNPQPNQAGSNGGGNTGLSLLGYPVWEVPSAVSTLTTDAAQIAVFCDPRSYIIVDRIGMNVEVVPTMLNGATPSFPTGQRGIYVYWRNTAKPIAADAGRQLVVQ